MFVEPNKAGFGLDSVLKQRKRNSKIKSEGQQLDMQPKVVLNHKSLSWKDLMVFL